jgi:hypothetical protein
MTDGEEVAKVIWRTLAEIAKREKEKAINFGDYAEALLAGFLEGLFRGAEKSL